MDLTPNEEQRLLRESVDRFIAERYDSAGRRRAAAGPAGFSEDNWKQFADLGWLGLPIAEEFGGLGGGAVEVGILMEAFGRGLVSEPYLSTIVLGAALVAERGDDRQKREILPQVAAGTMRLGFAHFERAAGHDLGRVETVAEWGAEGWHLRGTKTTVLDAGAADQFLVSAMIGASGSGQIGLFLVPAGSAGIELQDCPRLGGGRIANMTLADVRVPRNALLGDEADARPAVEAVVDHALVAVGAEAVGMMQVMLDMTLEYTKVRKQFGRPLAANQVIRHRLAEMHAQCDEARSMALRAALYVKAARSTDARAQAASGAKAKIGRCARFVAEQAVQLHGAMGVTEELELGQYFKRILAFEMLFGGCEQHYRRHAAIALRLAASA